MCYSDSDEVDGEHLAVLNKFMLELCGCTRVEGDVAAGRPQGRPAGHRRRVAPSGDGAWPGSSKELPDYSVGGSTTVCCWPPSLPHSVLSPSPSTPLTMPPNSPPLTLSSGTHLASSPRLMLHPSVCTLLAPYPPHTPAPPSSYSYHTPRLPSLIMHTLIMPHPSSHSCLQLSYGTHLAPPHTRSCWHHALFLPLPSISCHDPPHPLQLFVHRPLLCPLPSALTIPPFSPVSQLQSPHSMAIYRQGKGAPRGSQGLSDYLAATLMSRLGDKPARTWGSPPSPPATAESSRGTERYAAASASQPGSVFTSPPALQPHRLVASASVSARGSQSDLLSPSESGMPYAHLRRSASDRFSTGSPGSPYFTRLAVLKESEGIGHDAQGEQAVHDRSRPPPAPRPPPGPVPPACKSLHVAFDGCTMPPVCLVPAAAVCLVPAAAAADLVRSHSMELTSGPAAAATLVHSESGVGPGAAGSIHGSVSGPAGAGAAGDVMDQPGGGPAGSGGGEDESAGEVGAGWAPLLARFRLAQGPAEIMPAEDYGLAEIVPPEGYGLAEIMPAEEDAACPGARYRAPLPSAACVVDPVGGASSECVDYGSRVVSFGGDGAARSSSATAPAAGRHGTGGTVRMWSEAAEAVARITEDVEARVTAIQVTPHVQEGLPPCLLLSGDFGYFKLISWPAGCG